jgi:hypothetical protein
MLARCMPFERLDSDYIEKSSPKPLPSYVPEDVKNLVKGLLEKNPEKRLSCYTAL